MNSTDDKKSPQSKSSSANGFLWGAATSSHQVEGYNDKNDWWQFEAEGRVDNGERSGAATDHWNRFREDLGLAADLGLNSYRFSIEWSRVEPEEGRWDDQAFEWYEQLIAECEKRGLMPMLTLHHFTSPQWLARQGGWSAPGAALKFARFAGEVARRLGARVPLWCTLNEPMVLATGTYLLKTMPPGVFAPELCSRMSAELLRAHVMAYDLLHSRLPERKGPWKDRPVEVGIAHNMLDFMPERGWHPIERLIASVLERFFNRAWLDAVTGRKQHFGILGLVPYARQVHEARGRRTVDFLGINYYTKACIQWQPESKSSDAKIDVPLGVVFSLDGEPSSDMGWAVHPEGFGRILRDAGRYGLPVYVTENGIADKEDRIRPDYLQAHLREIARLVDSGLDVRGYYHWSLLDNFEWIKGFGPRFGLFQVDYKTFERKPTHTALLLKKILERHRVQGANTPRQDLMGS